MKYTITSEKTIHYEIIVEAENREDAEYILAYMNIETWENAEDDSRKVYVQESWSGTEWVRVEDK